MAEVNNTNVFDAEKKFVDLTSLNYFWKKSKTYTDQLYASFEFATNSDIDVIWGDYASSYFTIEALEDGLTAKLSANTCEYRIDDGDWNTLSADSDTPSINTGQTLSFRGNLTPIPDPEAGGIGTFTISKKCNLKGNIMSLLYGDDFIGQNDLTGKDVAFGGLFFECMNIVDASQLILPATTLAMGCYAGMFADCSSLTTAPEILPATTLTMGCYSNMFGGCSSLTTAPELPATTLTMGCYSNMFGGCSSLTTAPELPATTLAFGCYQNMFYGCSSLVTAPEILPATTLTARCYTGMFHGCSSLVTAPELPATILVDGCYSNMFQLCEKLNYIKMLATDISATDCLYNWVDGFVSSGTFVKHPDMTSLPTGRNGIPNGWTVEDAEIDNENEEIE